MHMGSIGFIDSGFGGLTILQSVANRLPLHSFVYLACGAKEQAAQKGVEFLYAQSCSIVVAASVRLLPQLQLPTGKELFGVASPVAELALQYSKNGRIGIITRNDTKCAELFAADIRQRKPDATIYQQACPMLVPLIEGGRRDTAATAAVLKGYLEPLLAGSIDVLILGNNHFGLIKSVVEKIVGPKVTVLDEGSAVAAALADHLARHPELEKQLDRHAQRQFFCTEDAKKSFDVLAKQFYGEPVTATQVTL